jgi:ABC-2 type transport system permease protein
MGYVDETGMFNDYRNQLGAVFVPYGSEEEARRAVLDKEIDRYFLIPSDYLTMGKIIQYSTERELEIPESTQKRLSNFLLSNLLAGETSQQIIERAKTPFVLTPLTLGETGQVTESPNLFGSFIVPYFFGLLLAISIFTSSGFLLQGVAEEKENRVMEIFLSSVSSRQLLLGKVLGLGSAGLLQLLIWAISARVVARIASVSLDFAKGLNVSASIIVLGVVYFLLGYLLFGVLMAAAGSLGTSARESQQLASIFSLTAVIPFMLMPLIIEHPNHLAARVLSIFPLTAPIMTMERLAVTDIAPWELTLSVVVLAVSVVGAMVLAAKVFRMGILMYGKRPSLREIIRYIREA